MTNAILDKRGMSLIEVLVSLTVLSIVSVAILKTNILAYQNTTVNTLREEATRLAEEKMNKVRSLGFNSGAESVTFTDARLEQGVKPVETVLRNLRGTQVSYTVQETIVDIGADIKQITVEVRWQYRFNQYNHRITTIMGREM